MVWLCGTDSLVAKMSEVTGHPPSEVVEDDVMNHLPTLDRAELVEVCKLIGLECDDVSGNRGAVLTLLMRHLCTPSDEDDKLTAFLQIHTHLTLGKNDDGEDMRQWECECVCRLTLAKQSWLSTAAVLP